MVKKASSNDQSRSWPSVNPSQTMICSGVGLSSHGFPLSGFIQVKMQFNQIMSWDFSHYKLVNLLKLFGK